MVKSQLIDIVEIIYHLSGDQRAFKSYGEIGDQGVSCTPSQRHIGLQLNSMECGFYDYLLVPLAGKLEVCRVSPSLVAALNLTTERLGLPLTIRTRNIEPCGLGGGPVYRSTVLPYSDAAPLTP